jgi:hypothetical protein
VEDRFRLFSGPEQSQREVDELAQAIAQSPVGTPLTEHFDEFVRVLSGAGAEGLRKAQYDQGDLDGARGSGRYKARYLYPDEYRILARLSDDRYKHKLCRWRIGTGEPIPGPCGEATPLHVIGGQAMSESGWAVETTLHVSIEGEPEHEEKIAFKDKLIVALGDSYISGEGNPDVPSKITLEPKPKFQKSGWGGSLSERRGDYKRAVWWDEPCHRSLLSWPVVASLAYSARRPNEAVTLVHLGCSGAEIGDIFEKGQVDLTGGGDEPSAEHQLKQLERLITPPEGWAARRPDTLLLSIGGNDSGFGGVLVTTFLPPNGYSLPVISPMLVGNGAGGVCPYRRSGVPLSWLCVVSASAQTRLERLPERFQKLAQAFEAAGFERKRIFQFNYPNPLLDQHKDVCRTPLNERYLRVLRRQAARAPDYKKAWLEKNVIRASAYRQRYDRMHGAPEGGRYFSGFEGIMGIIPAPLRGWRYPSWNFQIHYQPEIRFNAQDAVLPAPICQAEDEECHNPSPVECDRTPEPGDSEVCQALWVHRKLSEQVRHNSDLGWGIVGGHADSINGHGICLEGETARLNLPLVKNGAWAEGWTPQSYQPYAKDLPRWFRTTNDSLVTQYGGPKEFLHGSMHPTFQAHLAYAQAALETALKD